MNTLMEPHEVNINWAVNKPGVHRFVVMSRRVTHVRALIYDAAMGNGYAIHTNYDNIKRVLTVRVTDET